MKKAKQILAIIGIIILVALYALTLIAAIFDNTKTMSYLSAAIGATIIIPVILWVIQMFYHLSNKPDDNDINHMDSDKDSDK